MYVYAYLVEVICRYDALSPYATFIILKDYIKLSSGPAERIENFGGLNHNY